MLLFNHMGMLTTEDIKLIGEELGNVIEHNLTPQFEDIRNRLDRVETRLEGVETRLDGVETRLDGVETRLDGVETRLERVDGRLEALDRSIGRTDGKVNSLVNVLRDLHVINDADKRRVLS